MKHNFIQYTIHFNALDPLEMRPGYIDVIFMPIDFNGAQAMFYPITTAKMELMGHIPDRNDVAQLYKVISGKSDVSMQQLVQRTV